MTSRIEVVADVSFQCPSQMPLSKDGHVIETLSADPTNEPFRKWILPWTSCCGEHLVNAHSLNPVPEMATVNSVTVPNQISRHNIFGKCGEAGNGMAAAQPRKRRRMSAAARKKISEAMKRSHAMRKAAAKK